MIVIIWLFALSASPCGSAKPSLLPTDEDPCVKPQSQHGLFSAGCVPPVGYVVRRDALWLPGNVLRRLQSSEAGTLEALSDACTKAPGCTAFASSGELLADIVLAHAATEHHGVRQQQQEVEQHAVVFAQERASNWLGLGSSTAHTEVASPGPASPVTGASVHDIMLRQVNLLRQLILLRGHEVLEQQYGYVDMEHPKPGLVLRGQLLFKLLTRVFEDADERTAIVELLIEQVRDAVGLLYSPAPPPLPPRRATAPPQPAARGSTAASAPGQPLQQQAAPESGLGQASPKIKELQEEEEEEELEGTQRVRRNTLHHFRDVKAAAWLAEVLSPSASADVRSAVADAKAYALATAASSSSGLTHGDAAEGIAVGGAVEAGSRVGQPAAPRGPAAGMSPPPPAGGGAGVKAGGVVGQWTMKMLMAGVVWPAWDSRDAQFTGGESWVCAPQSQEGCGACLAFSLASAAETAIAAALRKGCSIPLSPQFLFFCASNDPPTCQAGWQPDAALSTLSTHGLPYASCYPWNPIWQSCTNKCDAAQLPGGGGGDAHAMFLAGATGTSPGGTWAARCFAPTQLGMAKAWIRTNGGVVVGFTLYQDLYSYRGGVYKYDGVSPARGSHTMLVVGYDDNERVWIAKNSWGPFWGENGFVLVSYAANIGFMEDLICGVRWSAPQAPVPNPAPPAGIGRLSPGGVNGSRNSSGATGGGVGTAVATGL